MIALELSERISAPNKQLLLEIKRMIQELIPEAQVLLYGSLARGNATPESDYDILALTPRRLTSKEEDAIYDAIYRFEVEQDIVVSIVFYARDEWNSPIIEASPYHKAVLRDGIAL